MLIDGERTLRLIGLLDNLIIFAKANSNSISKIFSKNTFSHDFSLDLKKVHQIIEFKINK